MKKFLILLMVICMSFVGCSKNDITDDIMKKMVENDIFVMYEYHKDELSLKGELSDIEVCIYQDGTVNLNLMLNEIDESDEVYSKISPYLSSTIVLSSTQFDEISDAFIDYDFANIKNVQNNGKCSIVSYLSYVYANIDGSIYKKGGYNYKVSNDYISIENLIFEIIKPSLDVQIGKIYDILEREGL